MTERTFEYDIALKSHFGASVPATVECRLYQWDDPLYLCVEKEYIVGDEPLEEGFSCTGIWLDCKNRVIDYDGVYQPSKWVVKALREAGYIVPRDIAKHAV